MDGEGKEPNGEVQLDFGFRLSWVSCVGLKLETMFLERKLSDKIRGKLEGREASFHWRGQTLSLPFN